MSVTAIEYNPSNVILTWGPFPLSGFNADDIGSVEFEEDAVVKTVGSQGEIVWTVTQNRGGLAKVQFLQGAPILSLLSQQCASTRGRRAPLVVLPFTMTDNAGTLLAVGPKAVIKRIPPGVRKKTHQPVEVTWDVAEWTKLNIGGIETASGPGGALVSAILGVFGP